MQAKQWDICGFILVSQLLSRVGWAERKGKAQSYAVNYYDCE